MSEYYYNEKKGRYERSAKHRWGLNQKRKATRACSLLKITAKKTTRVFRAITPMKQTIPVFEK